MNKKKNLLAYLLSIGAPLEQWIQNTIVDVGDFVFTFVRLFQVFANVITNAFGRLWNLTINGFASLISKTPASDNDTGGRSRFDRTMHHANGSLTPIGDAIFAGMGLSLLLGAFRGIYQKIHKTKNISVERLRENRMKIAATAEEAERIQAAINDDFEEAYPDLNGYRIKSYKTKLSRLHRLKVIRDAQHQAFTADEIQAAQASDEHATLTRLDPINQISNSPVGTVAGSLWNFSVNQSMVYWLAWYARVITVGMSAAVQGLNAIVTVGFTAFVGFTFSFWKYLHVAYRLYQDGTMVGNISKLLVNPSRTDIKGLSLLDQNNLLAVINAMISSRKLDESLKDPRGLSKSDLKKRQQAIDAILKTYQTLSINDKAKRKTLRESWIQKTFMQEEAKQNKIRLGLNDDDVVPVEVERANAVRNPVLRQHLLLSNTGLLNRRMVIATIRNVVVGFALPFFIFSMLATATVLFPPLGAVVFASTVLNSVLYTTVAGIVIGGIMGVVTPAAQRQAVHDYRDKANQILLTKEAAFTQLEARLQQNIKKISKNPALLSALNKTGYRLDKINVYNDDYFEKQRTQPTTWAKAKKAMKRTYEFVGGGQTGILITRFLFLGSMIGGGIIATVATFGAPLIFFGIAATLALVLGGLRLAHYRYNRNVEHKTKCLDHFDARLQYLKDRNAELEGFVNKNNPDPSQPDNSTVAPIKTETSFNEAQSENGSENDSTLASAHSSETPAPSASGDGEPSSTPPTSQSSADAANAPDVEADLVTEKVSQPQPKLSSSLHSVFSKHADLPQKPAMATLTLSSRGAAPTA